MIFELLCIPTHDSVVAECTVPNIMNAANAFNPLQQLQAFPYRILNQTIEMLFSMGVFSSQLYVGNWY